MPKKLFLLLEIFTVCGSLFFAVSFARNNSEILAFEAESFSAIDAPFVLERNIDKASNSACVSLPKGAGQGWRGKGSGSVTYRVEMKEGGDYYFWGRAYWRDGCTNAFFLNANDGPRIVFGNDSIYGVWHWVRSPALGLKKGMNFVVFSNHSDWTSLDKIIVTNDSRYLPEDLGAGVTRFYDGFAGCDADNTFAGGGDGHVLGSWRIERGEWKILRSSGEGSVDNCMVQRSSQGGMASVGYDAWKDYSASMKVLFTEPGRAGMALYHCDEKNSLEVILRAGEQSILEVAEVVDGVRRVVATTPLSCEFDRWYDMSTVVEGESVTCAIDGQNIVSCKYTGRKTGPFSLMTMESGNSFFDNVDLRFNKAD
jgi:hypothetical protein